jgi:hypothetical protein
MANTPVQGYPQPMGSKIRMVFDHTGPKSYGNIGTSSGTGDVINATDLGFGGFDGCDTTMGVGNYSASGNYIVIIGVSAASTTQTVAPAPGLATPKLVLRWMTTSAAFGAISTEVTNATDLSAETFRLDATMV